MSSFWGQVWNQTCLEFTPSSARSPEICGPKGKPRSAVCKDSTLPHVLSLMFIFHLKASLICCYRGSLNSYNQLSHLVPYRVTSVFITLVIDFHIIEIINSRNKDYLVGKRVQRQKAYTLCVSNPDLVLGATWSSG